MTLDASAILAILQDEAERVEFSPSSSKRPAV
jgi:uncharacterized protein with PIN domain